jgi:hypothetical protein
MRDQADTTGGSTVTRLQEQSFSSAATASATASVNSTSSIAA